MSKKNRDVKTATKASKTKANTMKTKASTKTKASAAEKKTTPYMSIYEYTALISARASIISNTGEPPMIEGYDPIIIAKQEVDASLVTLMIRRHLPDGTYEDWRPSEMIPPRY